MITKLIRREEVSALIGGHLKKMRIDSIFGGERSFGNIELFLDQDNYVIKNDVEFFENYFWGPDEASVLTITKANNNSPFSSHVDNRHLDISIEAIIEDILLIQDKVKTENEDGEMIEWNGTEGIIIITDQRQYAFYKENTTDEMIDIYRGHDVISKLESVNEHWDIFDDTINSTKEREIISAKTGQILLM